MAVKHNMEFLSPLSYVRLAFSYFKVLALVGAWEGLLSYWRMTLPSLVLSSSVASDILSPEVYCA